MKLPFGLEISRQKAAVSSTDLSATRDAWLPLIGESFSGAWQRSIKIDRNAVLKFPALFSCMTLIASDVSKLGLKLVQEVEPDVWEPITSPAFWPVLRKPNRFQNNIQFREHWILSKLTHGNTYALKVRNDRGNVIALYILDPLLVQPLVAPGAAVFYELQADSLSTIGEKVTVPASEIIHDRMNAGLWHPLVGVSPITACGLASTQGLEILRTSTKFFENGARPGGLLTAPGSIGEDTAERLKADWQDNFGGANVGKVAVLGDGLKYESMSVNPVDAQLIGQLNMSEKMVCTAFHVPGYKVGVGETPKYDNAQVLNQIYYSDCLQKHIEDFEKVLGEGIKLPENYGVHLNIDDLLKMDMLTQIQFLKEAVGSKLMKPNEGRRRLNLRKTKGGDSLWGQQQDHSLEALARRDEMVTPDNVLIPPNEAPPAPANDDEEVAASFAQSIRKALITS